VTEPTDRGRWLYWPYVLHLWTIFGLALSNALLGIAVLAAPAAVRWREVEWERYRSLLTPLALYSIFLLTSIATSSDPRVSWLASGEIFSLGTLVLGLVALRDEARLRLAVDGLVATSALLSVWGLAQFLDGAGGLEWRIRGPFSHYMTFAGVLLMADLMLVAQLASLRHGKWGWRWLALLAINAALVGSLTRSAWVALILALTILFLLRAPRFLLVLAPAALVILLISPDAVRERALSIFSLRNITNYDRLCMLEAGLHMVAERPLFGHGPQMVPIKYPLYRHPTAPRLSVEHLHNSYLQLAAERGLLSLAAYLWLIGGTLVVGYRGLKRERHDGGWRAELWLGAFAALLAFSFAGLFEDNWRDTEVQRVALFMMAVPYCLRANRPSRVRQSAPGPVEASPDS
jgi:O-antigen ligase